MRTTLFIIFSSVLVLVFSSCAKATSYGEAIPKGTQVVRLKDILASPKEYKEKAVLLEGNFGGICCPTDFNYKEGLESIEIYPQGFSSPKLEMGTPVRIYGAVKTIEKKEEESETGEDPHVYIEAKGLEVR